MSEYSVFVLLSFFFLVKISTIRPQRTGGLDDFQTSHYKYYGSDNAYLGHPQYYKYLKLLWIEGSINLEYTLRYNTTMRGFWISMGPQKGNDAHRICSW